MAVKRKDRGPTTEDWLAELARLSPPKADEGWTIREWAKALGISERVTNIRLRAAMEAGILKRGLRSYERLDGRPCSIPVYRIEKPRRGQ